MKYWFYSLSFFLFLFKDYCICPFNLKNHSWILYGTNYWLTYHCIPFLSWFTNVKCISNLYPPYIPLSYYIYPVPRLNQRTLVNGIFWIVFFLFSLTRTSSFISVLFQNNVINDQRFPNNIFCKQVLASNI